MRHNSSFHCILCAAYANISFVLILLCSRVVDASILLSSTSKNQAENSAFPNLSLCGFNFIDRVKTLTEAECPGVVSCAKCSFMCQYSPHSCTRFCYCHGAHTIGVSHCSSFSNRLYNFTGKGDEVPSLDSFYAAKLKKHKCKVPNDRTTIVEIYPGSFRTFDLGYCKYLLKRRGLFQSDAARTTNAAKEASIIQLVNSTLEVFFKEFAFHGEGGTDRCKDEMFGENLEELCGREWLDGCKFC